MECKNYRKDTLDKTESDTLNVKQNEVVAAPDPFYAEANMIRLRKAIADAKAGRLTEHELIEVGDE